MYRGLFLAMVLSSPLAYSRTIAPSCTAANFPPVEQDWGFSIDADEKPWTYSLTISEIAEDYLGTAIFNSLPERFSSIPGVQRVVQEDREYYRIKSSGLSATKLKAALWDRFKTVAAQACKRN